MQPVNSLSLPSWIASGHRKVLRKSFDVEPLVLVYSRLVTFDGVSFHVFIGIYPRCIFYIKILQTALSCNQNIESIGSSELSVY
jgi:hypothetical protein